MLDSKIEKYVNQFYFGRKQFLKYTVKILLRIRTTILDDGRKIQMKNS